jgi:hypothetical protein
MEARQFDRWTRLFGGATRRDAIKLLVTGMTGGLLASGGIRGAMAQVDAESCKKKGDSCKNNSDCCNDLKCNNNDKCADNNNNNNNNNCKKKGDSCKNNSDCCNDLKCNNNDKCREL